MAAIAGIVYPSLFQLYHLLENMLATLQHRGGGPPEFYRYSHLELGSIGSPLAIDKKKECVIGFDGFLTNAHELEQTLSSQGYLGKSGAQADLLIRCYQLWGEEFLNKIEGEFALFCFDNKRRILLLARDRIGKKPLYWSHERNHFLFASELKALLASTIIPKTADPAALASYLYFGYIPQDASPVKNVNKLLPGHALLFHVDGHKRLFPYWSYSHHFLNRKPQKSQDVVTKLDAFLKKTVKKELPKGERVGCLLSGGLGSASIGYYLSQERPPQELPAFTATFASQNDEDLVAASQTAKALHLPHLTTQIQQRDFFDHFAQIVWHLDEPLADPNIVATWQLAALASKQVRTVFSGMGSDELLAGHSRYFRTLETGTSPYSPLLGRWITSILNYLAPALSFKLLKRMQTPPWHFQYLTENVLFSQADLHEAAPKLAPLFDPTTLLQQFEHLHSIQSPGAALLYFDVKTRLPNCFILQLERLTAAHGLTWYAPYLNRRLIEYLAGQIEVASIHHEQMGPYLPTLMKNRLPREVINRPKESRQNFLHSWLQTPESIAIFKKLLDGTLVETGNISRPWLQNQIERAPRDPSATRYLFSILTLEVWSRLFLNRPTMTKAPTIGLEELLSEL